METTLDEAVATSTVNLTTVQFLAHVQRAGIDLWAEDGRLQFSAPKGALTESLREEIKRRKPDLVQFLSRTAASSESAVAAIPKVDTTVPLPLSFAQERLWFFDQVRPGSSAYNLSPAYRVRGALHLAHLEAALRMVVERHAVLRTSYLVEAGEPRQKIEPLAALGLPLIDAQATAGHGPPGLLRPLFDGFARRPFDLGRAPMARVLLVRHAAEEHSMLLVVHHIAFDGWSSAVMMGELIEAYQALVDGRAARLPDLPVQYADFAVWQRQWLAGPVLAQQLGYWRGELAGAPQRLELPTDRARRLGQGNHGGRVLHFFPPALRAEIEHLCRARDLTLFMVLSAAFGSLVARWSGQRDLLVGTPIANRSRPELERLVGFFANTLVIRTRLEPGDTVATLLARSRTTCLGAFANQDLPFERLVEELEPQRDALSNPLVQVLFGLENVAPASADSRDLAVDPLPADSGEVPFDLIVLVREEAGRLCVALRYRTALFDATTLERLSRHFLALLAAFAREPGRRLDELSPVAAGERHQLLVEWRGDRTPYPAASTVPEIFAARAAKAPHATALIYGERELSFGALDERSARWAGGLADLGVGPEVMVGVALARSPELVTAFLAVVRAGGAYVPLDGAYPDDRLVFMLEDAGVELVLVDASTRERWQALVARGGFAGRLRLVEVGAEPLEAARPLDRASGAVAENLAYVIYTSGSTGRPKGVAIPHRGIVRLVQEARYLEVRPGDRFIQISNASFDAATYEIWGALLNGVALVGVERSVVLSPRELGETLVQRGVTHLFLTVALFNQMAREAPACFARCRQVLVGGEAVEPSALRAVAEAGGGHCLWNGYGPTESTTFAVTQPILPPIPDNVPIGRPLSNTEVWVADRALRPVPLGVEGELLIGGDGLGRGYWRRPGLTAGRFVPDPTSPDPGARVYRTGDRVRWLASGRVEYLGRLDEQVKVRGFRIEPGEIETALCALPGVDMAAVVLRREADGDKQLVGYVVGGDGLAGIELRRQLAGRLPAYMIPAAVVVLPAFPLTANGKLDREALPDPWSSTPRPQAELAGPEEIAMARIWSEVLAIPGCDRDESFFELGGHSLLATQVSSRVREVFGVEMPVAWVFESPTVASLTSRLAELRQEDRPAPDSGPAGGEDRSRVPVLAAAPADAPAPLSFAQQRLWFLDQLDPGSTAYNLPAAIELHGFLHPAAFAATLRDLFARQRALATVFPVLADGPVQEVRVPVRVDVPWVELSTLAAPARDQVARSLAGREAARAFDLAGGPLFRVAVLRLAERRSILLLNQHHAISDGWSLGILLREIAAIYTARLAGHAAALPALPVQYTDFARWQRQWLQGETLARELDFWRRELEGAPALLDLPADRPRPPERTARGGVSRSTISRSLARRLEELGQRSQTTRFMVLFAAFNLLLSHLSGQRDLVVGTPVAGRSRLEIEGLVGFFVNTLVLRTRIAGTFFELLAEVRKRSLAAFSHQDLPFERLVEELAPERDLGTSPVFQVLFALQNAPRGRFEAPDLVLEPLVLAEESAQFDLSVACEDHAEGIHAAWEFSRDLFDRTTIERWARAFLALLEALCEAPEAPLARLGLLSPAQRHQLLVERNDTTADFASGAFVHELCAARSREMPGAPALVAGETMVSYGELERRVSELARRLVSLGVGPEVPVGLLMRRVPESVIGLLAIFRAGGVCLPLDPSQPADRLADMAQQAGRPGLLTLSGLAPETLPVAWTLALDQPLPASSTDSNGRRGPALDPDNLAYVVFTSGSTGRPKGVQVSHRALVHHNRTIARLYGLRPGDRVLQAASIGFDLAFEELLPTLVAGATAVLVPEGLAIGLEDFVGLLARHSVSVVNLPTSYWHLWAQNLGAEVFAPPPSLRLLVTGTEQALPDRLLAWRRLTGERVRWVNAYGPSEATITATTFEARGRDLPLRVPIGGPIAGCRVYVLGPAFEPVSPGAQGELFLGGAGLARAYLGRAAATAERFVPDPFSGVAGSRLYATGDLARVNAETELELLGREDAQLKVRGFRVELGEVESVLASLPGVEECAVVAGKDASGHLHLRAVWAASPAAAGMVPEDLAARLRERLPDYMVPASFVRLAALPKLSSGKVDRRSLLTVAPAVVEPGAESRGPANELESLVLGLWTEVLGSPPPDLETSFFAVGGHSLLGVQLVARIRQATGRHLPLAALFRAQTVAALGRLLATEARETARPALVTLREGRGPALCLVHPIGGNVVCYASLVAALDAERVFGAPVFACQAPAVEGRPAFDEVEAMAEHYLEAMAEHHAEGVLAIAGWSFGGVVAFEMASRLAAKGLRPHLVLLDAVPAGALAAAQPAALDLVAGFLGDLMRLEGVPEELLVQAARIRAAGPEAQRLGPRELLDRALASGSLPAHLGPHELQELFAIYQANDVAWRRYRPGRLQGPATLIQASQGARVTVAAPDLGWSDHLAGPVIRSTFVGDHYSLLQPPAVHQVAATLAAIWREEGAGS